MLHAVCKAYGLRSLRQIKCNCSVVGQHEPTTWNSLGLKADAEDALVANRAAAMGLLAGPVVLAAMQKIAAMCLPTGCIESCDLKQFML